MSDEFVQISVPETQDITPVFFVGFDNGQLVIQLKLNVAAWTAGLGAAAFGAYKLWPLVASSVGA